MGKNKKKPYTPKSAGNKGMREANKKLSYALKSVKADKEKK